jgi:hypothetical protein
VKLHTTAAAPGATLAPLHRPLPRLAWIVAASCVLTGVVCLLLECDGWYLSRALLVAFGWPWLIPFIGELRELIAGYVACAETATGWDLNGDGTIGPAPTTHRLVFVNGAPEAQVDTGGGLVAENDLRWMVGELAARGVAWRKWVGATLPSGRELTTYEDYKPFVNLLEKCGALIDRGPRSAGRLVMDAGEIGRRLGL